MIIFVPLFNIKRKMKINITLSRKTDEYGHSEAILVMRRRISDKIYDMRAKSGCFVNPKRFDKRTNRVEPYKTNKLPTPEVRRHNEQVQKLNKLIKYVDEVAGDTHKEDIQGTWLTDIVEKYRYPDKHKRDSQISIYMLFAEYLERKQFSTDFHKGNLVMIRSVYRYEAFRRAMQRRGTFDFNIHKIKKTDMEDYRDYLANEKSLSMEYPDIYARIISNYPDSIGKGSSVIEARGGNAVFKLLKKLKQFFTYLNREGITRNNPFDGFDMGTEKYGTPYYITSAERDTIAATEMPTRHLTTQRDIFVFHCLIGCRVSDLIKLTEANIAGGILTYTPHKTQNEGAQALQARIPLHDKAKELIRAYRGKDAKGRLFPFISNQKYNDAIKEIFRIAGITRMVEVRNALTGEIEQRPINEVASSHLARRTFCGNLYFKVQDPNLIGKMSGHTEGSKAFARYRKIEDETLKNAIDLL